MKALISIFLVFQMQLLNAMGSYKPGDTLYVWAISGLTLREGPSLNAAKLAKVPYGTKLEVLNYNGSHLTSVAAVPSYKTGEKLNPVLELSGDFAAVTYQGIMGYLFDGYLSSLPPLNYSKALGTEGPGFESYEEWATRNFGLLRKIQSGTFVFGTPSSAQWIFGNGISISTKSEKDAYSRIILPDVSMEEAFLIFNCGVNYEWQISNHVQSDLEGYRFEKKGLDAWFFSTGSCGHVIRFLPHENIAVITISCSC